MATMRPTSKLSRRQYMSLVGTGAAAGLAGCSNNSQTPTEGSGQTDSGGSGGTSTADTTQTEGSSSEPLTVWAWSGLQDAREKQAQNFKQKTGTELQWQYFPWENYKTKITSSIAAGNAPPSFAVGTDMVPQFASQGVISNVSELGFDPNNYIEAARTNSSYNDTMYAVPWYADIRLIAINKDMFKEAGLEVPSDPYTPPTWDQFSTWVNALGDEHGKGFVVEPQETFETFFLSNGGRYLKKTKDGYKCTFDQPEVVETANYWLDDLKRDENILPTGDYKSSFIAERAGIGYVGSWHYSALEQADMNYMLMPIPKGPSGDSSHSWSAGVYYSLSPKSDQQRGKEWLNYVTSPEVQARVTKLTGGFPGRKSTYESDAFQSYIEGDEKLQVISQEMENGLATARILGLSKIVGEGSGYGSAAIDRVWQGQASPDEAFSNACEKIVQNVDGVTSN